MEISPQEKSIIQEISDLNGLTQLEKRIFEEDESGNFRLNLAFQELFEIIFPDTLIQLTHLTNLDLSENELEELPESIGQLKQLLTLNLSDNHFYEFPESIGQFAKLKTLYLTSNQLSKLSDSLCQLTQLTNLLLSENELEGLPESIGQLKHLKKLFLDGNELTELPEVIGELKQLTTLLLPDNKLTTLPDSIGQLTQLTMLNLDNNRLTELPESIGQLKQLKTLSLIDNKLTTLPDSLGQLKQLTTLNLDNNLIGQVRKIKDFPLADIFFLNYKNNLDKHDLSNRVLNDVIRAKNIKVNQIEEEIFEEDQYTWNDFKYQGENFFFTRADEGLIIMLNLHNCGFKEIPDYLYQFPRVFINLFGNPISRESLHKFMIHSYKYKSGLAFNSHDYGYYVTLDLPEWTTMLSRPTEYGKEISGYAVKEVFTWKSGGYTINNHVTCLMFYTWIKEYYKQDVFKLFDQWEVKYTYPEKAHYHIKVEGNNSDGKYLVTEQSDLILQIGEKSLPILFLIHLPMYHHFNHFSPSLLMGLNIGFDYDWFKYEDYKNNKIVNGFTQKFLELVFDKEKKNGLLIIIDTDPVNPYDTIDYSITTLQEYYNDNYDPQAEYWSDNTQNQYQTLTKGQLLDLIEKI